MSKKIQKVCNAVFVLLTAGLFYLMPYIACRTMAGDKTDILMGMVFGFIPIGLLLLSLLYGFIIKRNVLPACMAAILGIPVIWIPVVAGDTVIEKLSALIITMLAAFLIVNLGAVLGILLRRLSEKIKASHGMGN